MITLDQIKLVSQDHPITSLKVVYDGDVIATFTRNGNEFIFEKQHDNVQSFIQDLENIRHGLFEQFYQTYVIQSSTSTMTISDIQRTLNVSRSEAKRILHDGISHELIMRYFSYWKVTKKGKVLLCMYKNMREEKEPVAVAEPNGKHKKEPKKTAQDILNDELRQTKQQKHQREERRRKHGTQARRRK